MNSKDFLKARGKVLKNIGNNTFKVELENNKQIVLAAVTARFRNQAEKKKRLSEGDVVKLEIPLDDLTKGRIIASF
jgi:translation initiation factor IF-1